MVSCNRRENIPFTRTERYVKSFFNTPSKHVKILARKPNPNCPLQVLKSISITLYNHTGIHFGIGDRYGIKLLTQIRISFSAIREHRFHHNFNCKSPVCRGGLDNETLAYYFLRCLVFALERVTRLSNISNVFACN